MTDAWSRGLSLIESGAYWEAHEALELVWHDCASGAQADAIQSLIQFAAAAYKIDQAREGRDVQSMQRGMRKLVASALERLDGVSPSEVTLDTRALAAALLALDDVRERWVSGGTVERAAEQASEVAVGLVADLRDEDATGLV